MDAERTRTNILKELFGNNEYYLDEYTDADITEILALHPLLLKVLASIKASKEKEVDEPINYRKSSSGSSGTTNISQRPSLDDLQAILRGEESKKESKKREKEIAE